MTEREQENRRVALQAASRVLAHAPDGYRSIHAVARDTVAIAAGLLAFLEGREP